VFDDEEKDVFQATGAGAAFGIVLVAVLRQHLPGFGYLAVPLASALGAVLLLRLLRSMP
jgi:hypothetical protein